MTAYPRLTPRDWIELNGPLPGNSHSTRLRCPLPGVEVRDLEIPVELEQRNRQKS